MFMLVKRQLRILENGSEKSNAKIPLDYYL